MKAITLEAILTSISAKADRSLGLRLCTPELTGPEKCAIMDLQNRNLRLLIQPIEEGPPEELIAVKREMGLKTPSQRMRAVLFIVWKNTVDPTKKDFDTYYRERMEIFINQVKSELPEPAF